MSEYFKVFNLSSNLSISKIKKSNIKKKHLEAQGQAFNRTNEYRQVKEKQSFAIDEEHLILSLNKLYKLQHCWGRGLVF